MKRRAQRKTELHVPASLVPASLVRAMRARGWDWKKLSGMTGFAARTLRQGAAGGGLSRDMKMAIEAALQEAIWSTPEEWAQSQAIRGLFNGREPRVLPIKNLQRIALRLGINYWEIRGGREALIARLIPALRASRERFSKAFGSSSPGAGKASRVVPKSALARAGSEPTAAPAVFAGKPRKGATFLPSDKPAEQPKDLPCLKPPA